MVRSRGRQEWEEEGSRARPDFQSGPGTCGATPDVGTGVEGGSTDRMRKRGCVASQGQRPSGGTDPGLESARLPFLPPGPLTDSRALGSPFALASAR